MVCFLSQVFISTKGTLPTFVPLVAELCCLESQEVSSMAGMGSSRPGAMSYEDLLLGLTVNADTYDTEEEPRPRPEGPLTADQLPFDISQMASFDFT